MVQLVIQSIKLSPSVLSDVMYLMLSSLLYTCLLMTSSLNYLFFTAFCFLLLILSHFITYHIILSYLITSYLVLQRPHITSQRVTQSAQEKKFARMKMSPSVDSTTSKSLRKPTPIPSIGAHPIPPHPPSFSCLSLFFILSFSFLS